MNEIKSYDYDQRNDILYIRYLNDRGISYADEQEIGVYIMKDMETDEVTGVMIFDPKTRFKERSKSLTLLGLGNLISSMNECLMATA